MREVIGIMMLVAPTFPLLYHFASYEVFVGWVHFLLLGTVIAFGAIFIFVWVVTAINFINGKDPFDL